MQTYFLKLARSLALASIGILIAIAILGYNWRAQAQAPAASPPLCECSKKVSISIGGELTNCQCGPLQCVVLMGPSASTAANPALACLK